MARTHYNIVLLLLLCLIHHSLARETVTSYGRHEIETKADLDLLLQRHEAVMVNYYTHWCGGCKRMGPDFDEAARFLEAHKLYNFKFTNVDCTWAQEWCQDEGVVGYPTIKVYHGSDDDVKYEGPKEAADLLYYLINGTYRPGTVTTYDPTATTELPPYTPEPQPSPHPTADNVVYISRKGDYAIVKLALPGLPVYNTTEASSAVILDFEFNSQDGLVRLYGYDLTPQISNSAIPAMLSAAQISSADSIQEWSRFYDRRLDNAIAFYRFHNVKLDYELYGQDTEDPQTHNFHTKIYLNLIGAHTYGQPFGFLLDSRDQKIVEINIEETGTNYRNKRYHISSINLLDRPADYVAPLPSDQICNPWSWRCPDPGGPPFYRFIWRAHFDENGRIGSLSWRLNSICSLIGWLILGLGGLIVVIMVCIVSPIIRGSLWFWIPFVILAIPVSIHLLRASYGCLRDFFAWVHEHVETIRRNRADDKDDDRWED